MATLTAHRTFSNGDPDKLDERLPGQICAPFGGRSNDSGLGGCTATDIAHARTKTGPDAVSYEFALRVGLFHLGG